MRPTQFVTQRVTIWEGLVEQPHVAKIRYVEPLAEISRQARCQPVQQPGAVFGVIRAALFELDDVTCVFRGKLATRSNRSWPPIPM
jgi:hypothetical protein